MAEIELNSQGVTLKELKKIGTIIRKNWWIVLIFLVISLLFGNFFAYKQTNIYSAQTSIILKSNDQFNPGAIISDNGGAGGFYSGASKTFVENSNEKRILQSYDLIAEAIQRLDFTVSYFIVGRIKTLETFQNLPIKVNVVVANSSLNEKFISLKVVDINKYQISLEFLN